MYRAQFRAIEDAVESWKADHDEAMGVCELEEVIRACQGLHRWTVEFVGEKWNAGFSGKVRNPDEEGRWVLSVLKAGIRAWKSCGEEASECAALGYVVDGADRIPGLLAELKKLADDFKSRWPFMRKVDIERGKKELAAGDFITGEDLSCELQGQGS